MSVLPLRLLLVLLLLSDYTLLTLRAPAVFSAWREGIVFVYVLLTALMVFYHMGVQHYIPRKYRNQIVIVAFFVVFYCVCGDLSEGAFRLFRSFAMPVLFALAVNAVCTSLTADVKLRAIFTTLAFMTFISGSYAIYQYLTIHEASQFWYWPLLSEKGFELEYYNSMRDDSPRISGFFTGTLEFSAFVLNTALFSYCLIVQAIRRKAYDFNFFIFLLVATFSTVLIIYGSVRTSMIGLVSAVFFMVVLQLFKQKGLVKFLGFGYFLAFTGSIFLYLTLGYTDDPSALDRVRQWYVVIESLNTMPFGVGLGAIGPGQQQWFDSFWLNLLASSGYLGLAIMMGLIYFYSRIVAVSQQLRGGSDFFKSGVADYLVVSYPFYLSSFFFQSYTNSVVLYLFALVIVVVMDESKYRVN